MIAIEAKNKIELHIKIKQSKPKSICILGPPFYYENRLEYGTSFRARKSLEKVKKCLILKILQGLPAFQ